MDQRGAKEPLTATQTHEDKLSQAKASLGSLEVCVFFQQQLSGNYARLSPHTICSWAICGFRPRPCQDRKGANSICSVLPISATLEGIFSRF